MRNIETARDIDPTHSRLEFLDVQVARERERMRLTKEQGVDDRVRKLLAQADEEMRIGRLIAPSSGNARRSLSSARKLDPTDPAVARGLRDLTAKLTEEARSALDAGELERAERFAVAARELGSADAALATIERQLLQAQRVARAPTRSAPSTTPSAPAESAATKAPSSTPDPAKSTPAVESAPATVAAGSGSEPIEAIGLQRTREVPARYPRDALLSRTEGFVDLEFTISPEGVPEDLVVRASQPRRTFDRAAMEAVRRWRFQPITRDGVPVAQRAKLRMTFKP